MKRFITSRINTTLSPQLQLYLWQLQDNLKEEQKEVDYLQVFHMSEVIKNGLVAVKHTTEVLPYEEIYLFTTEKHLKAQFISSQIMLTMKRLKLCCQLLNIDNFKADGW